MSVRTVDGHLYRTCAKLKIAKRAELAFLITEYTPTDRHGTANPRSGSRDQNCGRGLRSRHISPAARSRLIVDHAANGDVAPGRVGHRVEV